MRIQKQFYLNLKGQVDFSRHLVYEKKIFLKELLKDKMGDLGQAVNSPSLVAFKHR